MTKKNQNFSTRQQRAYRPTYEKWFLPVGRFFSKFMSANQASYFGVIFSIISMLFFMFSQDGNYTLLYIALFFIGISILMDMIDGNVARAEQVEGKKIGKYGALLDPVADRYAEVLFLTGIMLSKYSPPEWVLFCFAGMIMASYTRARGESLGPDKYG
ncbi:MAG: CDP-alcohol phosphatidyltransferase family protein, partial [Candidatus Kariarchaeaceae archaeon]